MNVFYAIYMTKREQHDKSMRIRLGYNAYYMRR